MITTKLTLENREKDSGRLIQRIEQPGRSFVVNFMHGFYAMFSRVDTPNSVKDITNANRVVSAQINLQQASCNMMLAAGGGDTSTSVQSYATALDSELVGIVIGTSNTAATPTDYKAGSRIAHGLAVGQVLYGGCGIDSLTIANPNGSFKIRREFTDVSGGNITINEVCLYCPFATPAPNWNFFCIYRDIIGGGLSIVNGNLVVATITVQITV